jgi:hypothetical protein
MTELLTCLQALGLAQLWRQKGEPTRALLALIYQRFTERFETSVRRKAKQLFGKLDC